MRSYLKRKRDVEKIDIGTKLNAGYDAIKVAYEKLYTDVTAVEPDEADIPTDGNDEADIPTDGSAVSFSQVTLVEIRNHEDVVIDIEGESRLIKVDWDNETDIGTSRYKEVSVTLQDGIEKTISCCKLEITSDKHGHYSVFPLSRHGGRVEWLYPDSKTRYVKVKAYLTANDWRYVHVDIDKQSKNCVYSDNMVIAVEVEGNRPGEVLRFPSHASFTLVGKTWLYDGDIRGRKWLDTVQNAWYPKFKPGTLCRHQSDQHQQQRAVWRVEKLSNTHGCCMAMLTCVIPNDIYKKGMSITVAVIELQQLKQ